MEVVWIRDGEDRTLGQGFADLLDDARLARLTLPARLFAGIVGDTCESWTLLGEDGSRYRFAYAALVDGGSHTVAVRVRLA